MNPLQRILLFTLVCCNLSATEQMPDVFIENGVKGELDTHWAYMSPLEQYFHEKKIDSPFEMMHTANYRGHVAHWTVIDNKLYLTKIMVDGEGKMKVTDLKGNESEIDDPFALKEYDLHLLFPNVSEGEARVADWFSGSLLIMLGPKRKELEGGYYTIEYDEFRILSVEQGDLRDSSSFTEKEFRLAQKQLFDEETDELSSDAQKLKAHFDAQTSPKE